MVPSMALAINADSECLSMTVFLCNRIERPGVRTVCAFKLSIRSGGNATYVAKTDGRLISVEPVREDALAGGFVGTDIDDAKVDAGVAVQIVDAGSAERRIQATIHQGRTCSGTKIQRADEAGIDPGVVADVGLDQGSRDNAAI